MELVSGVVRHYHWGNPEWIPRMLGQEPDGTPQAELWVGTHPSAACEVAGGGTLAGLVAADPAGALGDASARALPFLVKVLAAAEPLSIQVHPNAAQAAAGFAREDAAGIPRDAPHRTYRDDQPKPELVSALTRFEAKCGLRHPDATLELLHVLDVAPLEPLRTRLASPGEPSGRLQAALSWLLALSPDDAAALVQKVAGAAEVARTATRPNGAAWAADLAWIVRLADVYPGDIGVALALLLNHVVLEPGEALHLAAGQLHSYLSGVAVEVQAPSDNVVRGGLTSKHIDTEELQRLLDPSPATPMVMRPDRPVYPYPTHGDEPFQLLVADLSAAGAEPHGVKATGPALVVMAEGEGQLVGRGGRALPLARGAVAFIRHDDGVVHIIGRGRVHVAQSRTTG